MDNDRFAVLDLGSNTFHLLIVQINKDDTFSEVFRQRAFVGLASDGLGNIIQKSVAKGEATLLDFAKKLSTYKVSSIKIIGTAALRSAINGKEVIALFEKIIPTKIQIIDGDREAELIYKGVAQIADFSSGNHCIMDIGGGSVEFILIKNNEKVWAQSFDIGVGVLYSKFHHTEPIPDNEIQDLKIWLNDQLIPLFSALGSTSYDTLIGASGSFEVLASMRGLDFDPQNISSIEIEEYKKLSKKIVAANFNARKKMPGLPMTRVKLIVVAMLLIDTVLDIIQPDTINFSPYALKEGVIAELIENKKR